MVDVFLIDDSRLQILWIADWMNADGKIADL